RPGLLESQVWSRYLIWLGLLLLVLTTWALWAGTTNRAAQLRGDRESIIQFQERMADRQAEQRRARYELTATIAVCLMLATVGFTAVAVCRRMGFSFRRTARCMGVVLLGS